MTALQVNLPPTASRIIFVRHLPFKITSEEMYSIFGKYGAIRQIRLGDAKNKKTRGTAFVVYEDILDAKSAVDHLSGFNVNGRYLSVLYYQPTMRKQSGDLERQKEELEAMKAKLEKRLEGGSG